MSKNIEQNALEAYLKNKLITVEDVSQAIREGYIVGYDEAMKDFLEKACDYLQKNLWRVTIEDGEFRQRFVTDFQKYIQDESEN